MPNRKISELSLATSSLATDGLVIQRGGTNFRLEASNFSTGTSDTGSLVTTSSISGITQTFTKGDGSTYTNEIISASHADTAISASYAVSASVEIVKEVTSSYAETATSASHAVRADEADQSISASYAVSASLAQLALEAISSSYAISASHAEVSDEAISSSYAITASHATSTAGTLSNGTSVDAFSFDGSGDATVDISTYSASVSTDRTALSASLTTTDQSISSSVATLSGSASDARNQLASDYIAADTTLSASLTTTDQTISASVASLSGSASDARNLIAGDLDTLSASFNERINDNDDDIAGLNTYTASLKDAISVSGPDVTLLGDLTVQGTQSIIHSTEVSIDDNILSLNGTGATNGGIEVNDPSGPLSGSLLWDGANNRWIAGQSGSESVVLVADGLGILSSSAQIADDISGSSVAPINTLSGSASDARNQLAADYIAADTALSSSITSDYVKKAGDTMTGALSITNNSDSGLEIQRPAGSEPGLVFNQAGISRTILSQNSTNPFGLSIYDSTKTILRPIQVANPTGSQDAATKNYVDNSHTTGSDGQTIRFEGTTQVANSVLYNSGSQVAIGNTSPKAQDALTITDGVDTRVRIGRSDLSPDRDFLEIRSNFESGSLCSNNEHLVISASSTGGTANIQLNPVGGATYNSNRQIKSVADPTAAQDAATKDYVDNLLTSTISAAVWDPTNTVQTITDGSKITFNYNSSREIITNDSSQASWSTTNHEFALTEGTWHIMFDFRKDTQTSTAIRFFQLIYKTTAGTGTSGTLIDASPTIENTTGGNEKIHMEAFLTVPASTTYYVFAWLNNGGNVGGRFTKMLCRRIG